MPDPLKIAVLVSGKGTNLQAIIDAQAKGDLGQGRVELVVSDKADAPALEKARRSGVRTVVIEREPGMTREDFDERITEVVRENKTGLIVLAGFMRILGGKFVKEFYGRIVNIHPSLLPSFKGASAIADAFHHGVKVTGVTVHFVDEGVDSGPIIAQREVRIEENDTLDSLEEKIHGAEHALYPEVIRFFSEGRIKIDGKKVKVTGKQ